MKVKHEFFRNPLVEGFGRHWGADWGQYVSGIFKGYDSICEELKNQLLRAILREKINLKEMGFVFHINHSQTGVEIFFLFDLAVPFFRFLSLNPGSDKWLEFKFELEGKPQGLNDTENKAKMAAGRLLSDLARDGFPSEIKRRIGTMVEFYQTLRNPAPF